MQLAIVTPYPPGVTGIGQYGYHVSRLLAQSGLFTRITVLTGRPKISGPVQAPAPIQIEYAWEPDRVGAAWSIVQRLRETKPDLVWFNLGASIFGRSPLANVSGFFAPMWARKLGFPTVVTLHELVELADLHALNAPGGLLAPYGARLLTQVALQADVVCLTMRRYAKWLSTHGSALQYVHIPIGAYHQPEILEEGKARALLFFTTLAPFKGLETLLEAFHSLRASYPDLSLTIAGAQHARFPEYARRLRQTVENMPGIHWLGEVREENVRELFRCTQIVVLPYTASTGSSSVLYQAATWGRSIVASDLPETRAVAHESGLDINLFQRGNADNLAMQIKAQLDAPGQRRRQVENNFAAIQRNRPEDLCHAYLRAFNTALETRSSPKRISIPALLETV
jgi:glycosyltransferase involved in cell wall biosynthesis